MSMSRRAPLGRLASMLSLPLYPRPFGPAAVSDGRRQRGRVRACCQVAPARWVPAGLSPLKAAAARGGKTGRRASCMGQRKQMSGSAEWMTRQGNLCGRCGPSQRLRPPADVRSPDGDKLFSIRGALPIFDGTARVPRLLGCSGEPSHLSRRLPRSSVLPAACVSLGAEPRPQISRSHLHRPLDERRIPCHVNVINIDMRQATPEVKRPCPM
jgi:hypothetical protein